MGSGLGMRVWVWRICIFILDIVPSPHDTPHAKNTHVHSLIKKTVIWRENVILIYSIYAYNPNPFCKNPISNDQSVKRKKAEAKTEEKEK